MNTGKEFVERYPSMFTEDVEWWAQKLDEHFNTEEIINDYSKGVNEVLSAVPDNNKSLLETLGEALKPQFKNF